MHLYILGETMTKMSGGEAIVCSLIALDVDTIFGLPGVQNDYFFNALYDQQDKIRFIHTRHEQGAAYMAMGYALALDKPGVFSVVPGPGVLNTTAALSTAYAVNAKVLCLTGQIQSDAIGKNIGLLHEINDQLGVIRSLTKWAERITSPAAAPALMTEAFSQLLSHRPRPVGIEVPPDVLAGKGEVDLRGVEPEVRMPAFDPSHIKQAAKLLGQAENPMIFVGGGAQHAGAEVQALAEMLQAPIIPGRSGRGVVSNRHPFSLTAPDGYKMWPQVDVAIGIGARMYRPLSRWGIDENIKIIRLDIDPKAADTIAPPAVKIVADSQAALQALLQMLPLYNRKRPSREAEMWAYRAEMETRNAVLEPQVSYIKAIREALPEDGIIVDEVTQIGFVARFTMPIYHPRSYISTGYQGTLGFGFATALGVKVAHPNKPVLNVSGDGGFMYNVQELSTAVRHNINLVTVVFDNGAFGNVRRMQKVDYGGKVIGSDLVNPDFVKLAEAFGVLGLRAESPAALRGAIEQGFAHNGPVLIEVPIGDVPAPWPVSYPPANRGNKSNK